MKVILLILFFNGALSFGAHAEDYNLYIEYCPSKDVAECSEIKISKAVELLEKKGFKITDTVVTKNRIVIQLHDHCSYFQFCAPDEYAEEAIIRLQIHETFQTLFEYSVKRNIFPRTSKALLKEAIEGFNPI